MYENNKMTNKIKFLAVTAFCLSIIFITLGSTAPAQADDDFGIIFPESKSRLVDTDIEDESGSWGPDGPGGFFPGGIENVNPPGAPDPGSGDPGSGHPGHSGDPNHPDYDDRSFWERLRDLGKDFWDGAVEAGRDLGELASDTWDYITDSDGLRADAVSFGEWLLDGFVDTMSSVGEWFSDTISTAGEWFSEAWDGLSDWTQDLIVTIGIVLGVVAGIAVLVVVGLISIPVALVAAAGAAIAAGIYFLVNGGTDSFNWLHALAWTVGGSITGGLLQGTGGLAAGARALWVAARSSALSPFSKAGLGYFFGGFGVSAGIDFVSSFLHMLETGEWNLSMREVIVNGIYTGIASLLTFGTAGKFLTATIPGRLKLSMFKWPIYSGAVIGTLEFLRGYVLTGNMSFTDFFVGFLVGASFYFMAAIAKDITKKIMEIFKRRNKEIFFVGATIDFIDSNITQKFKEWYSNSNGNDVSKNENINDPVHDNTIQKQYFK
ncbi:hypothetical protein MM300_01775 [Evansella sp. LMS18]|uniref:hypothetical protein n=1 Tax=Evansella sp. LMS18 TaxID=2924033 RepID=UPI0020D006A0|nr:hypothetical protein [Evansella sp. LMS18]UTR11086.1 hypothetical protein MM300_01775 [Evansella sp. LMS18]